MFMFTSSKNRASAVAAATLALGIFGFAAAPAHAGTLTYAVSNFDAGAGAGASALNANFVFTIASGAVSVQINNTTRATASDAEEIYGLSFNLTTAQGAAVALPGTLAYTLTNGYEVSLSKPGKGNPSGFTISTSKSVAATTMSKPWLTGSSGDTVFLHIDTSKPNDMVIAPPPTLDNYGSAGGLNSVFQHSPSLLSGATFNLNILGAAANDVISNVVVQYGTTPTTTGTVPGPAGTVPPQAAPEPASLAPAALGLGIGALLLLRRRRKYAAWAKN